MALSRSREPPPVDGQPISNQRDFLSDLFFFFFLGDVFFFFFFFFFSSLFLFLPFTVFIFNDFPFATFDLSTARFRHCLCVLDLSFTVDVRFHHRSFPLALFKIGVKHGKTEEKRETRKDRGVGPKQRTHSCRLLFSTSLLSASAFALLCPSCSVFPFPIHLLLGSAVYERHGSRPRRSISSPTQPDG